MTEEVFWAKVQKTSSCWLYDGPFDSDGYGQIMVERKNRKAHRYVLELAGVDIVGKIVRHSCNTPPCVRPDHLIAGTQQQNIEDQLRAGTHSKLKYSDELIQQIREDYATGQRTQRALCELYGLSSSHLSEVVRGVSRRIAKLPVTDQEIPLWDWLDFGVAID